MADEADGPAPAALVLSGSIGFGHDAVASASVDGLATAGVSAEIVDCMTMLGGWEHRVGDRIFRGILGIPPVYDAFHFSALRTGARLARWIDDSAARYLVPAVEERLPAGGGLLLSVFASGAGVAGRISRRRPEWRSVVFCTDATAHAMWVHDGVSRYLVCSSTAAATVLQYDPFADVVEIPPPVRSEFFTAPSQGAAREALGLAPDLPHVLLTAGGWGLGPLVSAATSLADAGYHVLAVAGTNATLEARLRAAARARAGGGPGGITAFGFTRRMPELMAASDVVVTTSGQTCLEARMTGRTTVVLDIVPGHGRENLLLTLGGGGAVPCRPDPDMITKAVTAALGGAVPPAEPWPVASAEEWQKLFVDAMAGLVPSPGDRT